ncbi:Putative mycotoxin biosynthesis protein UstYa [Colletotrichum destructivum]|uniref:Mycotoxin biosynthesis protein UstYa n=1 Tax=Colletotrichum destructivum TaxID=34406 RepID=A0AAX4IY06_9PEZI|nr:Putative mycotoxin biosynthesis protein UstYa [Colletotrichum destructivum]
MGSKTHSDGEEDAYVASRGSSQEDARLIQSENEPPPPASRPGIGLRRLGPTFLLSLSNLISLSALLLLLVTRDNSVRPCVPDKHPHWIAPEIPVTKILEESNDYTRPPDEDELKAWGHLMPLGRGLVMVNSTGLPEMPGLNMSSPRGASGWTGIAHQLHCLYSTKHAFYDLYYNRTGDKTSPLFGVGWQLEHLNHCWDYVRQTIMCNPDLTVEWRGEHEGTGWGYQRQCKDWGPIYDWLEKHRITNDRGILALGYERRPLDTSSVPGVWSSKDLEDIDV